MGKRSSKGHFSSEFWKDSKTSSSSTRSHNSNKKQALDAGAYLYPIDESEEFYDPFSDLNLFLTKRIKKEMLEQKEPKCFSSHIQKLLLERILPEFRHKFPKYHLGSAALKKSWDKVRYFYDKVGNHKEILTPEGLLDTYRMIRSSLAEGPKNLISGSIHPYNFSHQLAVKISECIATLDSIRPEIDHLTKLIWGAQKHLIAQEQIPNHIPFEDFDKIDKLIVRTSLSSIQLEPELSHKALATKIKQKLESYTSLSHFGSIDELPVYISATLSTILYPKLTLHQKLSKGDKEAITAFVQGQLKRCRKLHGRMTKRELQSIASRTLSLYPLAAGLPKKLADKQLDAAMKYIYSLSTNVFSPIPPSINKKVFSFINSEIIALKDKKEISALENVLGTLIGAFQEGQSLPKLDSREMEELEVWIWAAIEKEEKLYSKLPEETAATLCSEVKSSLVEAKSLSFREIIHQTTHFFKQIRDFSLYSGFFDPSDQPLTHIDHKIERWSIQNDMVCAELHFDPSHPLTRLAIRKAKSAENPTTLAGQIAEIYIKEHPYLEPVKQEITTQAELVIKSVWYAELRSRGETNYERFIKWHVKKGSGDLETLSQSRLPLTPTSHLKSLAGSLSA